MTTTQNSAGATAVPLQPAVPAAPEKASGSRLGTASLPRAGSRGSSDGPAPIKSNNYALLQVILFWAGAILLPTGPIVILLGYYGISHTAYSYDQQAYLISGGIMGLALTFVGGFLYFGAWLARMTNDQRESSRRLADTLLVLADITSRAAAVSDPVGAADQGALRVIAGDGTTVHRRDCALIAHRDDLHPAAESRVPLTECRVCRPDPV